MCTIIYNSPNNFIRIQFHDEMKIFGKFFFQRWSFFAPPPQNNFRLIYIFTDKQNPDKRYSYEALQPVTQAKRDKSPFNTKETVIDYILHSSVLLANNMLVEQQKFLRAAFPDSSDRYYRRKINKQISKKFNEFASLKTLVNYAKIIMKKKGLKQENHFVDILLAQMPVPKLKNQMKKNIESQLNIFLNLKNIQFDRQLIVEKK